jgi:excinuclease ABC subunit C
MQEQIKKFPKEPGVYLMKDQEGVILYVGKAKDLRTRVRQYFAPGRDGRVMVPYLTAKVRDIEIIVTPSEKEALLLENTLIKRHMPRYNVLLKDDKSFISIVVNHKHKWPMLKIVRTKDQSDDGLYFGPYTSGLAARETLDTLATLFPLRQCSDRELISRKRPCLLYSIKKCIAPCVNKCTKGEYDKHVEGAVRFLKGQDSEIIYELRDQMEKASDEMEYERAGALLKQIRQLEHVAKNRRAIVYSRIKDCDAFAMHREADQLLIAKMIFREGRLIASKQYFFTEVAAENSAVWETFLVQHYSSEKTRPKEVLLPPSFTSSTLLAEVLPGKFFCPAKGEKKKLVALAKRNAKMLFYQEKESGDRILLQMQDKLGLTRAPVRIECFDTSNIAGSDLVASMVTFTDGEYDKRRRRTYKIRDVTGPDDYAAMEEVLTRRYTRAKEERDLPDLVIVDGGKGQLGVLVNVMRDLDIASVDMIALTKEDARHDKGLTSERVFVPGNKQPICLPKHSPILFLLQKIRDEAHRVAITYHRKLRQKRMNRSVLDEVPGIGPTKKKRLLTHFGSLKRILAATREDLLAIQGIAERDVDNLKKINE